MVRRVFTWKVHGPALRSYGEWESVDVSQPFLGIDYADNVDSRFGVSVLGPQINTLTLSDFDEGVSPANAIGAALTHGMNATKFMYVARGRPLAKVRLSDMSLVGYQANLITNDGFETNTSGWAAVATATIARSTTYAKFGDASLLVTPAAIYDGAEFAVTVAGATEYTFDCWVYSTAAVNVAINLTDKVDQGLDSGNFAIAANTWTQISHTATTDATTARYFTVYLNQAGAQAFYIDGCRLDLRSVAPVTVAEAATDILYTKSANGTERISIGMDNTAYHNITTVAAAGSADTASANNEGIVNRIMKPAYPENVIAGLGKTAVGGVQNVVRQNDLSGAVDMDASSWSTRKSLAGQAFTFTGFALDGYNWVPGTDQGPLYLDNGFLNFKAQFPEIGSSTRNCAQMQTLSLFGTVVPLSRATRTQLNIFEGQSIGPETYRENTSPIQGYCTGVTSDERWGYFNFYNVSTGETYICAARPRQAGDWHGQPVSYYPIATLNNTQSDFLKYLETGDSGRTNPTFVGGHGSNLLWWTGGRIEREIDDSNYRYATSGTLYLSTLRLPLGYVGRVLEVDFISEDCSSTETLTVQVASVTRLGAAVTTQVGAAVTSNGFQRLIAHDPIGGYDLRPQVVFASGGPTATPTLRGTLRMVVDVQEYGAE